MDLCKNPPKSVILNKSQFGLKCGGKFAGRGFRRDAENDTREACAPQNVSSKPDEGGSETQAEAQHHGKGRARGWRESQAP
jgi:hypothetical protein